MGTVNHSTAAKVVIADGADGPPLPKQPRRPIPRKAMLPRRSHSVRITVAKLVPAIAQRDQEKHVSPQLASTT